MEQATTKLKLKGIKNLVFDLGNVLLNLDFDASINAFKNLGLDAAVIDNQQAYADPVFYDLEVGRITPPEFRKRVREILNNPEATDNEIDDAWCAMILDVPLRRVKVIQDLKKQFGIYLFSNTNQIHISRLHAQFKKEHGFDFSSLFIKDYYSHELHERKPELSSYRKMMASAGIKPQESMFIDDLEKNIMGAQTAGMKTCLLNNGTEIGDLF
jgi:glucose-1-phosphatase